MSHTHYSETTLPTLGDAVAEAGLAPCLHCTILFHPDVERIGEQAVLDSADSSWMLGRHAPLFAAPGAVAEAALEDPYLSRRALRLSVEAGGLRLCRPQQASRCRVGASEVDELFITDAELQQGVPLLLAHAVVLLLRRCVPVTPSTEAIPGFVGDSPAMQRLRGQLARAAASDQDVLIRGETGVGKEMAARAICAGSVRAGAPMVTVNMAAIPASLATALLFGNTRGAFSGADRARRGFFREADGGTLFLDEVGDTAVEVQPQLLRALQQREVQVVGGAVETVDVRVISATDAALDEGDCDFKSALRYRLGALEVEIPPLREHPEDIGTLLLHFLRHACEREHRSVLLPQPDSSPMHLARWARLFFEFARYAWPGNVRQLQNYATQVVVASETAPVIPAVLLEEPAPVETDAPAKTAPRRMREISEAEFAAAMTRHRWEITPVAAFLGVSRQSVYRRIDQSELYRRARDIPAATLEAALARNGGDIDALSAELQVSASALRARLRAVGPHHGS